MATKDIVSLVLAAVSLMVGILAFMFENQPKKKLRILAGSFFIFMTIVFLIFGLKDIFIQEETSKTNSSNNSVSVSISNIQLEEIQKTGSEVEIAYEVSLKTDEVIVGDSYEFDQNNIVCNAFLIKGPGNNTFVLLDGGWYRYSGVSNETEAEELLQGRIDYLKNHWFCKNVNINVIRK